MELEAKHEIQTKQVVAASRRLHAEQLWNLTVDLNILHPQNWTDLAEQVLENYTKVIFNHTKHEGWDGQDDESEVQWSFAGSLLYSVTVVTTIGMFA